MKIRIKKLILVILTVLVCAVIYGVIYRDQLIVAYMANTSIPAKRIPQSWMAPVLKYITGLEFTLKVSNAEGIFEGGRDPAIFIRSQLSVDDVNSLVECLSENATVTNLDRNSLENVVSSGYTFFPTVAYWEKELGIKVFDMNALGVGMLIENTDSRGYTAFIDEENMVVYIYAYSDWN